jgi:hypothetical protein
MRFDQQKSACSRAARVAAVLFALSASGSGVFASGQGQAPSGAAQDPQAGMTTLRLSSEDAVRMALENNLGIRAEQLNPQIETYAVAQARALLAPGRL